MALNIADNKADKTTEGQQGQYRQRQALAPRLAIKIYKIGRQSALLI
jgi:hypothetical protein